MELKPHQREAVDKLDTGKILCGLPGVGKSLVAVTYYLEKEAPKDVYVITTAKKRDALDWDQEFVRFGVGTLAGATTQGVLRVDSWNNIDKYKDVKDAFFIFDEQRLVGSGAWTKAFIRIARRNTWILLSATPGDTWLDYIPVFVANGFYQNRTEFKEEHVIYKPYSKFPKVDRYVRVGKLVRLRNEILVDMPYERHTTRHQTIVKVDFDQDLFKRVVKDRWHVFEMRPLRDAAELFAVMRKVVNSDSTRLDALRSIMRQHPKVIVFYNFDYELEMLRTLVNGTQAREQTHSPASTTSSRSPHGPNPSSPFEEDTSSVSAATPSSVTRPPSSGTRTTSTTSTTTSGSTSHTEGTESCLKTTLPSELNVWKGSTDSTAMPVRTENDSPSPRRSDSRSHRLSESRSWSTSETGTSTLSRPRSTDLLVLEDTSTSGSTDSGYTTPSFAASNPSTSTSSPGSEKFLPQEAMTTLEAGGMETSPTRSHTRSSKHGMVPCPVEASTPGSIDAPQVKESARSGSEVVELAEWNGHKHQPIPKTDRWVYLVQYAAGAEGWNCIETDAMVFYSLTYSYKMFFQAFGRIDRLNTPFKDLYYYVLRSDSLIDKAVWKALMSKKSFNERGFKV